MKRRSESLKGPYRQEPSKNRKQDNNVKDAIGPALKVLEESRRRAREQEEVKTREDEEEVIMLCRKVSELHDRCKKLAHENQETLRENARLLGQIKKEMKKIN